MSKKPMVSPSLRARQAENRERKAEGALGLSVPELDLADAILTDAPLRIEEAAAYLRVSIRTVRRWLAEDNPPPSHRLPGTRRLLFYRSELDRWVRGT